jgi:hypothetical protein
MRIFYFFPHARRHARAAGNSLIKMCCTFSFITCW